MNKHGFLMLDSMVVVVIVAALAVLCISFYSTYGKYQETVNNYYEKTNERLIEIYNKTEKCEACKAGNN